MTGICSGGVVLLAREVEDAMRAELGLSQEILSKLIREDAFFRAIWEDLLLVREALEHWRQKGGPDCPEARQYRQIQQDRTEEMQAHLQRRQTSTEGD
jgi:hypothetical protein